MAARRFMGHEHKHARTNQTPGYRRRRQRTSKTRGGGGKRLRRKEWPPFRMRSRVSRARLRLGPLSSLSLSLSYVYRVALVLAKTPATREGKPERKRRRAGIGGARFPCARARAACPDRPVGEMWGPNCGQGATFSRAAVFSIRTREGNLHMQRDWGNEIRTSCQVICANHSGICRMEAPLAAAKPTACRETGAR